MSFGFKGMSLTLQIGEIDEASLVLCLVRKSKITLLNKPVKLLNFIKNNLWRSISFPLEYQISLSYETKV